MTKFWKNTAGIAALAVLIGGQSLLTGHGSTSSAPTSAPTTTAHVSSPVHIGETGHVRDSKYPNVYVFKSQSAMDNVAELARANADNSLIYQQMACIVPNGTTVMVNADITGGFMSGLGGTSDVLVINGPHSGCKGVVNNTVMTK
jgi:hypothetical protein